jgi:hypothetical protein
MTAADNPVQEVIPTCSILFECPLYCLSVLTTRQVQPAAATAAAAVLAAVIGCSFRTLNVYRSAKQTQGIKFKQVR